ncbi:hypothetical protein HMPREF0880_01834 [Yokenella regensburgei ATCC 43003]|nr:hypothetical protein HMPREF0880_01834 [Yokenella regensburgei ATCC 43003]
MRSTLFFSVVFMVFILCRPRCAKDHKFPAKRPQRWERVIQ